MIAAELYLDPRKNEQGYPLKIRIRENRKYKYVSLKIYSKTQTLKLTTELIKRNAQLIEEVEYCNVNKLNLEQSLEIIKNGIPENPADEIYLLKQRLAELENKNGGIGILNFFDLRIKEKESIGDNVRAYRDARKQLANYISFEKDVPINHIDYEWINGFIMYKKRLGTNQGGINAYLRTIRAVYKEAQKRKSLNIKSDNPFLGTIKATGNKVEVELSPSDLKKLFYYKAKEGSNNRNKMIAQRNINIILFQFAIGGHDYADVAALKWSNIVKGRLKFKRYKNRNKPNGGRVVNNMLNDFANEVIDKYGTRNSERIFSFIPDIVTAPDLYNDYLKRINRSLATISTNLGLPDKIKTKTTRYLFNTYASNLLINRSVIEQLQGHTASDISSGYNVGYQHEVLDAEHQKVLDLVFGE